MITRAGQKIYDEKFDRREKARHTVSYIEHGKYEYNGEIIRLKDYMYVSMEKTQYYPHNTSVMVGYEETDCKIEVTKEKTHEALMRFDFDDDVVILNFASAKRAGGGWLRGAKAQEEDLALSSSLFMCLKSKPDYYKDNIAKFPLYTDGIIYSGRVPFFRDKDLEKCELYTGSVITCPAPNVSGNACFTNDREIAKIINRRAKKILGVARLHNHKKIILGAWGCGVFNNDAKMVAKTFKKALAEVGGFDYVCFAIYDQTNDNTYNIFKEVFEQQNKEETV